MINYIVSELLLHKVCDTHQPVNFVLFTKFSHSVSIKSFWCSEQRTFLRLTNARNEHTTNERSIGVRSPTCLAKPFLAKPVSSRIELSSCQAIAGKAICAGRHTSKSSNWISDTPSCRQRKRFSRFRIY